MFSQHLPEQTKDETSNGLSETPASGIIQRIDSENQNSLFPLLAQSNNNLYVVWQDNSSGTNEIFFKGSNNNGNSFRGMRNLSNNTGNSEFPQIAAAGNNVYVVWQDNSSGTNEIFFKGSKNNGNGFRGMRNLSNNTGNSEFPQIAAAGNNVYVVWQDNSSGTNEIFFKGSNNNGNNFKGIKNLSNNTGNSEFPQIAAAGNNVYVVWQDNSSGNYEVLLKVSNDGGKKFSGIKNLSNNTGNSEFPQIAAAGNNVYVVWQDDTNSTPEIPIYSLRQASQMDLNFGL